MEKYYLLTIRRESNKLDDVNYENHKTTNVELTLMRLWKDYKDYTFILINVLEISKEFYDTYEGGM